MEMISQKIKNLISESINKLGLELKDFTVEHSSDMRFGDYSTNVAIIHGHKEEILEYLNSNKTEDIERIELAGPGFINFYLSKEFFKKSIAEILENKNEYGKNQNLKKEKIIIEYTDPNPFKEFHIGHLMSNTIGEALSRIIEWNGAEIKRACYQGDVGMHVAKAIWGAMRSIELGIKNEGWGKHYAFGAKAYKEDELVKKEIEEINKKIYERSDENINKFYDTGREESLKEFEKMYERLGTKFDNYFFESESGPKGKKIVEENIGKVFEKSEGAIIFRAEKFNQSLHTRVFINSEGVPTYEAKELGLAPIKYEKYPYQKSIVITGNEVDDYFKVVLEAMKHVLPELAEKTTHLSHGMMRLPSGKVSSRTGDVVTADELIDKIKEAIEDQGNSATDEIAVGAIKYMILRQSIGGDIIFDFKKSISIEGDSGIYLQYAFARSNSLLDRAGKKGSVNTPRERTHTIERLLYRFPEAVSRAFEEHAPSLITNYLTQLSSAYNSFYTEEQVISDDPEAPYRLAITEAFNIIMKNGLDILAIPTPERI